MPIFPVILKPKCLIPGQPHNHKTMENVQPCLQMYMSIRSNIPNVQYFNMIEFLVKELELRIEIEREVRLLGSTASRSAGERARAWCCAADCKQPIKMPFESEHTLRIAAKPPLIALSRLCRRPMRVEIPPTTIPPTPTYVSHSC